MPMDRIEDPQAAFMRTQSIEMRKFWETYPPKRFYKRPGAGRSFTAFSGRRPSLRFNLKVNSENFIVVG